MLRNIVWASIVFCFAWMNYIHAQNVSAEGDTIKKIELLDETVITARKINQKLSQTGKVITVIGQDIIAQNQGKTVTELLNQQVGITIIGANNNLGTNQDLYIRGAANGYSLVLLNGIPVYDPSNISNSFDLNLISIDQIDHIEILKGGQSTLYGSDALAGVINIITKKAKDQKIALNGSLAGGSYNTLKGNIEASGILNNTSYSISYGKTLSDGFSTALDKAGNKNFDKDGFNSNNLNLLLNQQINQKLSVNLNAISNDYKAGIDQGAFTDGLDYDSKSKNLLLSVGAKYLFDKGLININYNHNTTQRLLEQDSSAASKNFVRGDYKGKSGFIEIFGNYRISKYLDVIAGVDRRLQNMASNYFSISKWGPYKAPSLDEKATESTLNSAYATLSLENLGIFGAEIGGRFNQHSVYGNNSTYSINPYINYKERVKIFANLNSGFKVPSQYQLFSEYGTPDLKPTQSQTIEIGTQLFSKNKKNNIRAVLFRNNANDVVIFKSSNAPPWGKYVNFDKQRDRGLEVDGTISFSKVNARANYTYVKGEVSTKNKFNRDTTIENLYRRPNHTFNLSLGLNIIPRWNATVNLRSVSKALSGPFDSKDVVLGDYTTIDLYQDFRINKYAKVYLDAKNLTNKTYFDIPGYNTRKFNFMAGVLFNL